MRDFAHGAEKMGFEEFLKQHDKSRQSARGGPSIYPVRTGRSVYILCVLIMSKAAGIWKNKG